MNPSTAGCCAHLGANYVQDDVNGKCVVSTGYPTPFPTKSPTTADPTPAPIPTCSGGRHHTICGTCDKTCLNQNPMCTADCKVKCQCPSSAPFWDGPNDRCHTLAECAAAPEPTPAPTPSCTGRRTFNICGTCDRTCDVKFPNCGAGCMPKCECPPEAPFWDEFAQKCHNEAECATTAPTPYWIPTPHPTPYVGANNTVDCPVMVPQQNSQCDAEGHAHPGGLMCQYDYQCCPPNPDWGPDGWASALAPVAGPVCFHATDAFCLQYSGMGYVWTRQPFTLPCTVWPTPAPVPRIPTPHTPQPTPQPTPSPVPCTNADGSPCTHYPTPYPTTRSPTPLHYVSPTPMPTCLDWNLRADHTLNWVNPKNTKLGYERSNGKIKCGSGYLDCAYGLYCCPGSTVCFNTTFAECNNGHFDITFNTASCPNFACPASVYATQVTTGYRTKPGPCGGPGAERCSWNRTFCPAPNQDLLHYSDHAKCGTDYMWSNGQQRNNRCPVDGYVQPTNAPTGAPTDCSWHGPADTCGTMASCLDPYRRSPNLFCTSGGDPHVNMFAFTPKNPSKFSLTAYPLGPYVLAQDKDKDFVVQACHKSDFSINTGVAVKSPYGNVKNLDGATWILDAAANASGIVCSGVSCLFPNGERVSFSGIRAWIVLPTTYCGNVEGLCGNYNPSAQFQDAYTDAAGHNWGLREIDHEGGTLNKTAFVLTFAANSSDTLFNSDECPIVPYSMPAVPTVPFEDCPQLEVIARAQCPQGPFFDECVEDVGNTCNVTEWVKDAEDTVPPGIIATPPPQPVCTGGRIFNMCGSSCLKTCVVKNPVCTTGCVAQCECPASAPFWDSGGASCITDTQCAPEYQARRRRYVRRRRRYVRRRRQPYPVCNTGTFREGYVCTDCPAGKFQDATGQTTCSDCETCPAGHFRGVCGSYNGGTCVACPTGKFKTSAHAWTTGCANCDLGQYAQTEGAASCANCGAGQYSRMGHTVCFHCPQGKYAGMAMGSACADCTAGQHAPTTGLSVCDNCPAGTYQHQDGAHECIDCAAGQHNSDEGELACSNCTAGHFASAEGQSTCTGCATGTYQPAAGSPACIDCPTCGSGTYRVGCAAASIGQCDQCPAGKYKTSTHAWDTGCTDCALGHYADSDGTVTCDQCPTGEYSRKGHTICFHCPTGKYAGALASSECNDCAPGYHAPSVGMAACSDCPAGKFQEISGLHNCDACPAGKYNPLAKQSTCPLCDEGTYTANPGQTGCTACATGQYQVYTGKTTCVACDTCAGGNYRTGCADDSAGTCLQCSAGQYKSSAGSWDTGCTDCAFGQYAPTPGHVTCVHCATGQYALAGHTLCFDCPTGKFQGATQQSSCIDCAVGHHAPSDGLVACVECPAGKYQHLPGIHECPSCPSGKYNPLTKQTVCPQCPTGTYTDAATQTSCTACENGRFQLYTGRVTCTDCTTCTGGNYRTGCASSSAGVCNECPAGKYKTSTHAWNTGCTDCGLGDYAPAAAATVCLQCATGQYARMGHTLCFNCPTGKFANAVRAAVCDDCIPGYHAPTVGLAACVGCPTGKYQHLSGIHECPSCPSGKYNPLTEQTFCPLCDAGTYSPNPTLTGCTACETGRYQVDAGQSDCSNCDSCPAGNYRTGCASDSPGACNACALGQHKSLPSAWDTMCVDCALGTYAPATGQPECDTCPSGKYSRLAHSFCFECPKGKYANHDLAHTCYDCAEGKHSPTSGHSDCVFCPRGKYQNLWGKHDCFGCVAGKFQAHSGRTSCDTCPYCVSSHRHAHECSISLMRDCTVSGWSGWGSCSKTCHEGLAYRTKDILVAPRCGGAGCPPLSESKACMDRVCECDKVECKYDKHDCTTYFDAVGGLDSDNKVWSTFRAQRLAPASTNAAFYSHSRTAAETRGMYSAQSHESTAQNKYGDDQKGYGVEGTAGQKCFENWQDNKLCNNGECPTSCPLCGQQSLFVIKPTRAGKSKDEYKVWCANGLSKGHYQGRLPRRHPVLP